MGKDYCRSCTNVKTELCQLCKQITTVKGEEQTPSYYVGIDEILLPPKVARVNDLAAIIEARAKRQQPIPLYFVMDYNKLLEEL